MDFKSYLERVEVIRNKELISIQDLAGLMDISYHTWRKMRAAPETCSFKVLKKIKKFVDDWEAKNLSVKD